ncbi:MAG: DNA topoisomerase VI subunit B [Candidatus Micrarchaeota archaeon]
MAEEKVIEDNVVAAIERDFKEYSVAEFFKKNRQMLGYSGKVRSLTTIIHEYVTNSLDACEDAKILPEISVEVRDLPNGHVKVIVQDNGTGLPKSKVGQALGQLLAGTKFHQRMQKRGQQGIGAAYATLFAQITTGKPTKVKTGTGNYKVFEAEVSIDVKKNVPVLDNVAESSGSFKGLRIEAEFAEVTFNRSEYGVYEYLRRTALANPHAQLTLIEPNKEITVFPRASKEIPKKPGNILPHPLGITTSDLMDMAGSSTARKISSFLTGEFSRFSSDKVKEIDALVNSGTEKIIDFNKHPGTLQWNQAEELIKAFQKVKWIAPEMSSLQPIGEKQIEISLKNLLEPEFLSVRERRPRVFRGGIPFLVECGIAYGGKAGSKTGSTTGEVLRFSNRVPLLFDAGNCAITEAVKTVDWNRYHLKDLENQPVTLFVNFVSVYVPYTGAGKLAISAEEEIVQEIRQGLMDAAREVSGFLGGLKRAEDQEKRRQVFFKYIGEVSESLHDLTGKPIVEIQEKLRKIAKARTEILLNGGDQEDETDVQLKEMEEEAEKAIQEEG